MGTTFERSALYEEVWKEPLTKLGKKYGLSDNGLRKICKAMNIPLPSAGHWAKIAAGHHVPRVALPAQSGTTSYTSQAPHQAKTPFHLPEDDLWQVEQDALEVVPGNVIRVDPSPPHWHRVAIALREIIDKRLKEVQEWRELAQRAANRSIRKRAPTLDFDSWKWESFVRDGGLAMHAPLRVSQETHSRALGVVNAICYAAEARGFIVGLNADKSRVEIKGHGGAITMRMRERLEDKVLRTSDHLGGPLTNKEVKLATGCLTVFIGSSARSESDAASDDGSGKVESKLAKVFLRINRLVVRDRELERQHEAWKRNWDNQETRRAAAARRKAIARKRRRILYREVRLWQRAGAIRNYVAQVMAAHPGSATDTAVPRLERWQRWAEGIADELDPTTERVARLCGSRGNRGKPSQFDQSPGEIVIPHPVIDS